MAVLICASENPNYGTGVGIYSIAASGTGYTANDVLVLDSGNVNATFRAVTVDGSGCLRVVSGTSGGSGYSAGTYNLISGTGTGGQLTITAHQGLSTVSSFYRVEAYNLGFHSLNNAGGLGLPQRCTVTFANSCNLLGFGAPILQSGVNAPDKEIVASLQQTKTTCTMTIASPCVITCAGHGYLGGEAISFATTGALPTGITAAQRYYVKYINSDTFNISLTAGGTSINTSGSQSGTHTIWDIRASVTKTATQLFGDGGNARGEHIIPFTFSTSYAVDTTSSKWSLVLNYGNGSTGTYVWDTVNYGHTVAGLTYFAWGDSAQTFNDNDAIIVKDYLTIDKTATILGVVSSSGTDYGGAYYYAITICSNPANLNTETVALLKWQNPPVWAYTLTVNGQITVPTNGGMDIGTPSLPIPLAQQAVIKASGATPNMQIYNAGCQSTSTGQGAPNCHVRICGAVPSNRATTVPSGAALGQKVIVTAIPTGWQIGDRVYFACDFYGSVTSSMTDTIANISGTTITLTNNLTYAIPAGAAIFCKERYGIIIGDSTYTKAVDIGLNSPSSYYISGVCFYKTAVYNLLMMGIDWGSMMIEHMNAAYKSAHYFCDTFSDPSTATYQTRHISFVIPALGYTHSRNHHIRTCSIGYPSAFYGTASNNLKSGSLVVSDNIAIGNLSSIWNLTTGSLGTIRNAIISGNKFYNLTLGSAANYWIIILAGSNITYSNNEFYGCSQFYGCTAIYSSSNITMSGNKYNRNTYGVCFESSQYILNCISRGDIFGNLTANVTADLLLGSSVYCDALFDTPLTTIVESIANLVTGISGSKIRIQNETNTSNKDRCLMPEGNIVRCGDGLSDTTVRTTGSGKFSMRFQPTAGYLEEWEFDIPTSNIQNQTAVVGVWVKINSATFYAGTHQKPRLNINYDNGTTAYCQAAETTDWQYLFVAFTPTTTYGQITITIDGQTDATGTSAYFYVDDFSFFLPPGNQLDLGGLDLWADALPIVPPIATNITAADVWNVAVSMISGTSTIGMQLKTNADAQVSLVPAGTADAVWDESRLTHVTTGTYGKVSEWAGNIDTASIVDAVWDESRLGHVTTGTYGYVEEWASSVDTSAIADAVWNESRLDHVVTGTYGITSEWAGQVDTAAIADAIWDESKTGHIGDLKTMADNLDTTVSSRLPAISYVAPDNTNIGNIWVETQTHPTLTEIEASTILAKQSAMVSVSGTVSGIDTKVDTINTTVNTIAANVVTVDGVVDSILKTQKNRWRRTGSSFIIYDDDGTTPLYSFTLKDSSGNAVTDTTVAFERTPA